MMSCTDLITMCLLSAKHSHEDKMKHRASPQLSSPDLPIFQDIFRRADKNDDGKLSFEEFQSYFTDGILNQEELRDMFSRIDNQKTNNMDTEQLCDYFSKYLGEYQNVLTALEKLNVTILTAMDKTKLDYEKSSQTEQFVTRLLLRETMNQLHSLQNSLECALETVEVQTGRERQDVKKTEPQRVGRRCNRKSQKSVCLSPTDPYSGILTTGLPVESDTQWSAQINRLEQLIDKLECTSPLLEPLNEELTANHTDPYVLVIQRQLPVSETYMDQFKMSLKRYTETTATQSRCLHISTRSLHPEPGFILYEIWADQDSWRSHLHSVQSKAFQRVTIDCLESPEQIRTMLFPASWWNLSRN
ncbi:N-terminal EF-hand calcium-binding protein 3 [Rhinophrynus dorsalis]